MKKAYENKIPVVTCSKNKSYYVDKSKKIQIQAQMFTYFVQAKKKEDKWVNQNSQRMLLGFQGENRKKADVINQMAAAQ